MLWLVWFLFVFGLVYLITAAAITVWPRAFVYKLLGPKWGGWLACAPCTAFWVGLAVGLWDVQLMAYLVPAAWQTNPLGLEVVTRLAAAVLAMGAVSAYQFSTHTIIAELGQPPEEEDTHWDDTMELLGDVAGTFEKHTQDMREYHAYLEQLGTAALEALGVVLVYDDEAAEAEARVVRLVTEPGDKKEEQNGTERSPERPKGS